MNVGIIDAAFGPFLIIFGLISFFLFTRGKWMTTPDTAQEAFCYSGRDKSNTQDLLVSQGDLDSPRGGGQILKRATTDGAYDEEEEDPSKTLQLPTLKAKPDARQ